MKQKIISMILVVCLLLNLLPAGTIALADETAEVKYSIDGGNTWTEATLSDAVLGCYGSSNAEIRLQRDITLTDDTWTSGMVLASQNEKLIIDGDGHTVTRGSGGAKLFSVNSEGSEVVFKNITIDGGAKWSEGDLADRINSGITISGNGHLIAIDGNAKVTLESGTVLQNSALDGASAVGAAVTVGESNTNGCTLIIKSGVQIKDNYVKGASNNVGGSGAAVYVREKGQLIMEGGNIYNNYASVGGGAITNRGNCVMSEGRIYNNYAGNNSGAVCVEGGEFTMTGGSITENKAVAGGGAIAIFNTGVFTMTGGSITGNNSGTGAGGGGILRVGGTCKFQGTPVVLNNTVGTDGKLENVKLRSTDSRIIISGTLQEDAKIGITTAGEGDFSSGWSDIMGGGTEPKDYFISDDLTYGVSKNKNTGEAMLCEHTYGNYTPDNNATCEEDGTETAVCSKCETKDTHAISGTAIGHKYGTPEFVWQEDGSSCMAVFTCENDSGHIKEQEMEITSEITKPADTQNKGETTYTASVTFEGREYKDIKTIVDIPVINPGTVDLDVEKEDKAPSTRFDMDKEDIENIVLTEEEKEERENGKDIKIILSIEDADDSVSEEDKASVDRVKNNFIVGQYLDISLSKIIGDITKPIFETENKIRITVDIPDRLKNKNSDVVREYSVIRVHDGMAEMLLDMDADEDTVTIETDRFSTYSLMYHDIIKGGSESNSTEKPTTAESSEPTTAAPTEPTTDTPSEPTTNTSSEPTTAAPTEPTTNTSSEPTTAAPTEPTTNTSSEPTTDISSEPSTPQTGKPTDNTNGSTGGGKPQTGDITPVEVYATAAMIAGFTYLLLFGKDEHGMTEEDKKRLVGRIIQWAHKGSRLRRVLAFPVLVIVLAYYHSVGKRSEIQEARLPM